MALAPCRECGHQVSTDAAVCPSCGIGHPVASTSAATPPVAKPTPRELARFAATQPRTIALLALGAVALAGVIWTAVGTSPPQGCALADEALGAYGTANAAVSDHTATPADSAAAMGKVADKLSSVALIAESPLQEQADNASLAAGRLRTALLGEPGVDVASEGTELASDMDAIAAACS